ALAPIKQIATDNGIKLDGIVAPSSSNEKVKALEEGPLTGLLVLENAASFAVSADPSVGCNLNLSQPTGSISPLQFTAFAVEGAQLPSTTSPLVPAFPAFAWGRQLMSVPSGFGIK